MSERWKLEAGLFAGERIEYVNWDVDVQTPPDRTEERSCWQCGVKYAAHVDVSEVREAEGTLRAGKPSKPYANRRRLWRETTTLEPHYCRPQPRIVEVTACQFTRLARAIVSIP